MPSVNEERLSLYLAAERAILSGQSYRVEDRQVERADLAEVRAEIQRLQTVVAREQTAASGRGGRFSQANFSGCD